MNFVLFHCPILKLSAFEDDISKVALKTKSAYSNDNSQKKGSTVEENVTHSSVVLIDGSLNMN